MIQTIDAIRAGTPLLWVPDAHPQDVVSVLLPHVGARPLLLWDAVSGMQVVAGGAPRPDKLGTLDAVQACIDYVGTVRDAVVVWPAVAWQSPQAALTLYAERWRAEACGRSHILAGVGNSAESMPAIIRTVLVPVQWDQAAARRQAMRTVYEGATASVRDQGAKLQVCDPESLDSAGLAPAQAADMLALAYLQPDPVAAFRELRHAALRAQGLKIVPPKHTQAYGIDGFLDIVDRVFKDAVVWIDEIEKALAGATSRGDSGVSADQLSVMLQWLQAKQDASEAPVGFLLVGPPGTGKSLTAHAVASRAAVPLVQLDLGAVKSRYVGESEAKLRAMLAATDEIASRPVVIATSNGLQQVPAELLRRFTGGIWYLGLPSQAAIAAIIRAQWPSPPEDCEAIAAQLATLGMSGADVASVGRLIRLGFATEQAIARVQPIGRLFPVGQLRDTGAQAGWLDAATGLPLLSSPPTTPTRKFA